jgi:hypothetical protein
MRRLRADWAVAETYGPTEATEAIRAAISPGDRRTGASVAGTSRRKPPPGPRRAAMGTPTPRSLAMSRSTVRTSTRSAAASSSAVACRPAARRSSSMRRCCRSTRSRARWGWVGATGRTITMLRTSLQRPALACRLLIIGSRHGHHITA